METLILSLPVELRQFLDEQIARGETASYSDYILQKLSKEKDRQEFLDDIRKNGFK